MPINNKLEEKLDLLTKLHSEMNQYRPLSKKQVEQLDANVRIEHVWSSNAIEGSTLNRYETASILNTGMTVHGASLRDTMAAVDLNEAYDYMMDLASRKQPLTTVIIRDLNRLVMLKNTDDRSQAGAYRVIDVWPNGQEDQPYTAPTEIPFKIQELIDWSEKAINQLHPVQYAADLHQKFVSIHPFVDGNGRTARLLMNFALSEAGYPVVSIMPDKKSRNEYMEALATSRATGNLVPFEELVADYAISTLKKRINILRQNEKNIEEAKEATNLRDY
ncbi:Fic family protein [Limosilactobacillus sp. STM2_1]|uniref:Fic family protein n=1 Tax=Limosilactobacillus rudii TaxID=2759755 RepID=A0A7W3UL97_9LACO|nr:Fic family protein [Limosilactobacillus rudii]MBB1078779.1 Fic family protein [Limosilactobacillus rudii]MBB1097669.1 Fic family protein [Limosilactobacillus rudii]MCD7134777.1 Fic family protein [Limosilactobacillus rudii]